MLRLIFDRKAKAREQARIEQEELETASQALQRRVEALFQSNQQQAA